MNTIEVGEGWRVLTPDEYPSPPADTEILTSGEWRVRHHNLVGKPIRNLEVPGMARTKTGVPGKPAPHIKWPGEEPEIPKPVEPTPPTQPEQKPEKPEPIAEKEPVAGKITEQIPVSAVQRESTFVSQEPSYLNPSNIESIAGVLAKFLRQNAQLIEADVTANGSVSIDLVLKIAKTNGLAGRASLEAEWTPVQRKLRASAALEDARQVQFV